MVKGAALNECRRAPEGYAVEQAIRAAGGEGIGSPAKVFVGSVHYGRGHRDRRWGCHQGVVSPQTGYVNHDLQPADRVLVS